MLKYIELRYLMIQEFKDELTDLKIILRDTENLMIIRQQQTKKTRMK